MGYSWLPFVLLFSITTLNLIISLLTIARHIHNYNQIFLNIQNHVIKTELSKGYVCLNFRISGNRKCPKFWNIGNIICIAGDIYHM